VSAADAYQTMPVATAAGGRTRHASRHGQGATDLVPRGRETLPTTQQTSMAENALGDVLLLFLLVFVVHLHIVIRFHSSS
jgi:hypothetical protein